MSKGNFVIDGNTFYIVEKCYKKKLKIREINRSLTRKDCDHTYDFKMLRKQGYVIDISDEGNFL